MAGGDAMPSMLSTGTAGVQFLVLALSSDDSEHRWKGSCALESPLSQLARKWANMHQVPENSVGFEWKGEELELQKTAADYSFSPSEQVELLCFPKTEEFMEPVEPTKADVVVATSASVGRKKADAAKNSRPEQDQGVTEGSNKRKREASSAEAKSEKAETSKVEKKRPRDPRGAGKENAPKVAKPSSAKGSGGEKTSAPGLEEPIQFLQTNPKKAGGTSFHRYEKYKHAKTVKEALALGAAKGDIAYDWKQGFFKRV
mmetsp:Transcript_68543/g.150799  ORF Transcript_68543/g.150799 Transcript_68543/m.150799 type:complete len:258 (+) Transcript_68543:33-806(+)